LAGIRLKWDDLDWTEGENQMTEREAKEYKAALKKVTSKATSSQTEARKFLRKAGIVTPSGKLTKHYK
jgi:hypothetical protein